MKLSRNACCILLSIVFCHYAVLYKEHGGKSCRTNIPLPTRQHPQHAGNQRRTEEKRNDDKGAITNNNCYRQRLRILCSGWIRSQLQFQVCNALYSLVPYCILYRRRKRTFHHFLLISRQNGFVPFLRRFLNSFEYGLHIICDRL